MSYKLKPTLFTMKLDDTDKDDKPASVVLRRLSYAEMLANGNKMNEGGKIDEMIVDFLKSGIVKINNVYDADGKEITKVDKFIELADFELMEKINQKLNEISSLQVTDKKK